MGLLKRALQDQLCADQQPAQPASEMDSLIPCPKSWAFGAGQSGEGVKTFPVTSAGKELMLHLQGCHSPFDASSLTDGARKTLTLRLPSIWEQQFVTLECLLIAEAAQLSPQPFGTKFSEEDLRARYKSVTKKAGDYAMQLRAKVNTEGFYSCRYWDKDRQRIDAPDTHAGLNCNAALSVRGLWVSPENFGLVVDCTDLQIIDDVATCPF